jgi:hypothetical protein
MYTFTFNGMTAKNVIISGRYSIADDGITFKQMSAACSSMKVSGCTPVMGCRGRRVPARSFQLVLLSWRIHVSRTL